MKISVIILNYNVSYFLKQCVLTVEEALAGIESEIIIIDNNSSDDSCNMVKENFPHHILIENKMNLGFSKANNQGVAIAKGEYICILNPDTALSKSTFHQILDFVENKNDIGAIGIRLIDGTGNYLPESKRNIPTPRVSLYKILGLKSKKYSYYATHLDHKHSGQIEILVGAFMFIKKSVYQQVGGFDEDYFMYGEDIDLSYKLIKANYKNYYLGGITMLHYKGESTIKNKKYLSRFYGAMHIFYKKHFNSNRLFKILVKMCVFMLQIINIFKSKPSTNSNLKSYKQFVLSDNILFLQKLNTTTSLPYKSISKSAVNDSKVYDTCFIFDANYISYQKIFESMEFHKNNNTIFRIRPINSLFILGSDSPSGQGEIVLLND